MRTQKYNGVGMVFFQALVVLLLFSSSYFFLEKNKKKTEIDFPKSEINTELELLHDTLYLQ
jgi:hypothetical protein